jgi:hypothetical protein
MFGIDKRFFERRGPMEINRFSSSGEKSFDAVHAIAIHGK